MLYMTYLFWSHTTIISCLQSFLSYTENHKLLLLACMHAYLATDCNRLYVCNCNHASSYICPVSHVYVWHIITLLFLYTTCVPWYLFARYAITKAFVIAFVMTFFSVFDVPVFWPILLCYWIVLFVLTMKRQILHMVKYKYVPFNIGKQKYGGKKGGASSSSSKDWSPAAHPGVQGNNRRAGGR